MNKFIYGKSAFHSNRIIHWLLFARFQSMGCWKFYLVHTSRARRLSPPVLAWPGLTLPKTEPRRNAGQWLVTGTRVMSQAFPHGMTSVCRCVDDFSFSPVRGYRNGLFKLLQLCWLVRKDSWWWQSRVCLGLGKLWGSLLACFMLWAA